MTETLCIGLMSGTSVDGMDAALTGISDNGIAPPRIRLIAALCAPLSAGLRARILALTRSGDHEIDRLGALDVELGHCFADAALQLLRDANIAPEQIAVIGSHGQTVRHRPGGAMPFTLQIGDPNIIAERTGITTVADFRRRDIAAGGQGAPLVPAFHAAFFRAPTENRALLNIGGMANVTLLPNANNAAATSGFDTGPGNVLLDAWHERHHGVALDRDGAWARNGQTHAALLARLLADPWFGEPPPKSTGREHFCLDWLDDALKSIGAGIAPADVQATLTDLSARSMAEAIARWGGGADNIYLCGGGTHNLYLRECLARFLPQCRISSSAALGVDPDWMEAMAFAWLAHRTLAGLSGNLPAVTGARHPVILGGIYPGKSAGG